MTSDSDDNSSVRDHDMLALPDHAESSFLERANSAKVRNPCDPHSTAGGRLRVYRLPPPVLRRRSDTHGSHLECSPKLLVVRVVEAAGVVLPYLIASREVADASIA